MQQQVKANLRYLRMSPRKVRLVADMIRGRRVERALQTLMVLGKRPAKPLLKLLKSAIANAEQSFAMSPAGLKVASIMVDGGPALKRWMPKAHGRATPVREPTAHVKLVLTGERDEEKNQQQKETKEDIK